MADQTPIVEVDNPATFLTSPLFTIPVDIPELDSDGKVIGKKRIFVTYSYDESTRNVLKKGKMYPAFIRELPTGELIIPKNEGDTAPEGYKEGMRKRDLSNVEMILLVVKEIKGVPTLDTAFVDRMPPKYQEAITDAVMRDAFPSLMTSTG